MNEELKPCPFCGGTGELHIINNFQGKLMTAIIKCEGICQVHTAPLSTIEGATEAWNMRTGESR